MDASVSSTQIQAGLSFGVVIETLVIVVPAGRLVPTPRVHEAKIRLLSLKRDWLQSIRR